MMRTATLYEMEIIGLKMEKTEELDKTLPGKQIAVGKTYMFAMGNKQPAFGLRFHKVLAKVVGIIGTNIHTAASIKIKVLWAEDGDGYEFWRMKKGKSETLQVGKRHPCYAAEVHYIHVDDWGQIFFQEYDDVEVEKFLLAESL